MSTRETRNRNLRDALLLYVEPRVRKHVEPALLGDVDAAFSLACLPSNERRGEIAVAFWRARAPIPAFRTLLQAVWEHDHRYLIRAARSRQTLQRMFLYACFPIPESIPPVVRVWRGSSYLELEATRRGLAWTLNRDVACWFAIRFAEKNGSPLIVCADVPRESIALYSNDREEEEVVLFDVPAVTIDGNAQDWTTRHRIHADRRRAEATAETA